MSFQPETIVKDGQTVCWAFHINIGSRSVNLAQSKPVRFEKDSPIWKTFFTQLKSPVYRLDQLENYHALVDAVVENLEEIANGPEVIERVALSQVFQNEHLKNVNINGLISDPINKETKNGTEKGNTQIHPQDLAALYVVLYKAIYRFLQKDNRYLNQGAELAYFFSAWQWFNLTKQLSMVVYKDYLEVQKKSQKSGATKRQVLAHPYLFLIRELSNAHQALAQMLQSPPNFDEAIKWLSFWTKNETKSPGLLREQMRLSLPLIPSRWLHSTDVCEKVEYFQPIQAPGWEGSPESSKPQSVNPHVNWGETVLHPIFQETCGKEKIDNKIAGKERTNKKTNSKKITRKNDDDKKIGDKETPGRQAIRRLIGDWLLPRYDFDNSVQFARLLKENCSDRKQISFYEILIGAYLLYILFLVAYPSLKLVSDLMGLPSEYVVWGCIALEWLGLAGLFLFIRRELDHSVLPYLLLPRVAGGIMVGYIALILSEDSYRLMNFFIQSSLLITVFRLVGFWLFVLALSYFYLYYDSIPFVGAYYAPVARGRAIRGVSVTLALTLLIGFFVLGIASQMYLQTHIPQSNMVLLGPIGLIDWQTFVVFVPFALLTGLVTQFIFEEKTVTTSVWAPEVE